MLRILSVWRIRQMDLCSRVFIHASMLLTFEHNRLALNSYKLCLMAGFVSFKAEQADPDMMYRDYRS